MKQTTINGKEALAEIAYDVPTIIHIPGTKRKVKITGIKPYTIERLTRLWLSRDIEVAKDSSQTMKHLCSDPYFNIKQAVICILNDFWKIRFIYPFMWRLWAYVYQYTEEQINPLIIICKKKLPLMPFWRNMAFTVDMRNDWMRMTSKEAEEYRAELLLVMNQRSLKNSPATEASNGA